VVHYTAGHSRMIILTFTNSCISYKQWILNRACSTLIIYGL